MGLEHEHEAFDREVRRQVYDHTAKEGLPPTVAETAAALSAAPPDVRTSFRRLAEAHVLVLQQGGEILMAAPFSAVPTPFLVRAGGQTFYANCVWDALGIPAMLGLDADIEASCGCCGTAMALTVAAGSLVEGAGVAHFALPAARWWDNVVFT